MSGLFKKRFVILVLVAIVEAIKHLKPNELLKCLKVGVRTLERFVLRPFKRFRRHLIKRRGQLFGRRQGAMTSTHLQEQSGDEVSYVQRNHSEMARLFLFGVNKTLKFIN